MRVRFLSRDIQALLGACWSTELEALAVSSSVIRRTVHPNSPTSREAGTDLDLAINVVPGDVLVRAVAWLEDLYRLTICAIASSWAGTELIPAKDIRSGVNLNIMAAGEGAYECHVDSNAIQAILYVTDDFEGGDLVIGHRLDASSRSEVDVDASIVNPERGVLIVFEGMSHPHYVRPVRSGGPRLALIFNYYSDQIPESARPRSLDSHLYGNGVG